jgi:hypothetical protein
MAIDKMLREAMKLRHIELEWGSSEKKGERLMLQLVESFACLRMMRFINYDCVPALILEGIDTIATPPARAEEDVPIAEIRSWRQYVPTVLDAAFRQLVEVSSSPDLKGVVLVERVPDELAASTPRPRL